MPAIPEDAVTPADVLYAAAESLDYFDRLIVKAADVMGIISDEELVEAGVLPGDGQLQGEIRMMAEDIETPVEIASRDSRVLAHGVVSGEVVVQVEGYEGWRLYPSLDALADGRPPTCNHCCRDYDFDDGVDGADPCLGVVPGIAFACCGHGVTDPLMGGGGYFMLEDRTTVYFPEETDPAKIQSCLELMPDREACLAQATKCGAVGARTTGPKGEFEFTGVGEYEDIRRVD